MTKTKAIAAAPTVPGITLTQSGGTTTVSEGGAFDSYTVVLNTKPSANVTITLDNTNNQVDTDKISLIFTPDNWSSSQTVTVNAVNDSVGEGQHIGVIKHAVNSADTSYSGIAVSNVQVAITDNDLPIASPILFAPGVFNPFDLTSAYHYSSPALVDIDGDGDLDLFSGQIDGKILFFRNTGSATAPKFRTEANTFGLTAVDEYSKPSFADIDGDGDQDLFIGGKSGSITFFRNTGSATVPSYVVEANNFGLPPYIGAYACPTFADIDGDGDLDALVGTKFGDTLFFQNTGNVITPRFTAAGTLLSSGLINAESSPALADIDGDGDLDALVGARNGKMILFRNTGTVTTPHFVYDGSDTKLGNANWYAKPVFGDLDGDGDLDVLAGTDGGRFYFFRNDPSIPVVIMNQSGNTTDVAEGGVTDSYILVLNTQPSANVTITLESVGKQVSLGVNTVTFTPSNWFIPQTVSVTAIDDAVWEAPQYGDTIKQTVTSADTNYNGYALASVLVTLTDNDRPVINLPFMTPAVTNPFGLADVGELSSPSFGDINNDGDLDAVIGNNDGKLLLLSNIGSKTAPNFAAPLYLADVGDFANPTFVDIDGDGDKDIFAGNHKGELVFLPNTGSATGFKFSSGAVNPFGFANHDLRPPKNYATFENAAPSFVDIDGDGDLDAFVGYSYTAKDGLFGLPLDFFGYTEFYRNTGTATAPHFVAENVNFGLTYIGDDTATLGFIDIDGDGDFDAFVGDLNGNLTFFLNTGSKTQPNFRVPFTHFGLPKSGYFTDPTFADIDGDGDLDALVGNIYGNTLLYASNQKPTFSAFSGVVGSAAEDSTVAITLSQLKTYGNEADKDTGGSVVAFVVTGVTSGTLKIGANAASATPWVAGSNDTIDDSHQAFWTPVANANGTLNAFTVIAKDNSGEVSSTAVQAQVNISAVNDAPTTSSVTLAPIAEDSSMRLITQAQLLANAHDLEGNHLVAKNLVIVSGKGGLVNNGDGTWNYIPEQNDDSSVSFSYTITDNGSSNGVVDHKSVVGSATIDIIPVNHAPKFTGGNNDIVYYDSPRDDPFHPVIRSNQTGTNLTASDVDGDVISFGVVGGMDNGEGSVININTYGTLIVNKVTGNYIFIPNDAAIEPLSSNVTVLFEVTAFDGLITSSQILAVFIDQWGHTETMGNDFLHGTIHHDTFDGLAGDDTILGGVGADTMVGGSGNDSYEVDDVGDKVIETSGHVTEIDTVFSSVSYQLPHHVENLTLTGTNEISGHGNYLGNIIIGNDAANALNGDMGNDTLTGGLGNDSFQLTTLSTDTITDFSVHDDTIELKSDVFTQLTQGILSATHFAIGEAADADDFILYNSGTGVLTYDSNGNGDGGASPIAVLGAGLHLTHADFLVI